MKSPATFRSIAGKLRWDIQMSHIIEKYEMEKYLVVYKATLAVQQSLLGQHFFASVQQVAWVTWHVNISLRPSWQKYLNFRSQRPYFQMLQNTSICFSTHLTAAICAWIATPCRWSLTCWEWIKYILCRVNSFSCQCPLPGKPLTSLTHSWTMVLFQNPQHIHCINLSNLLTFLPVGN